MRYYVIIMVALCFATLASAEPTLSERQALIIAKKVTKQYCMPNGCTFKTSSIENGWNVLASLIHSFDAKGEPVYMPEGTAFLTIFNDGTVKARYGNEPNEHVVPPPAK